MRFMMVVIPKEYETAPEGVSPDVEAMARMMEYNRSLQDAGVLLGAEGLHPPSTGVRVSFPRGKPRVQDGPFAEAKEVIGGFWIINVNSREEAVEWAKKAPMEHSDIIEVRQVQEVEDFPADVQAAAAGFERMQTR